MTSELAKLGADVIAEGDEILITGAKRLHGAELDSHNDHRVAMSVCIAAASAGIEITLTGGEAVNKSYPEFYDAIKGCGVTVIEI